MARSRAERERDRHLRRAKRDKVCEACGQDLPERGAPARPAARPPFPLDPDVPTLSPYISGREYDIMTAGGNPFDPTDPAGPRGLNSLNSLKERYGSQEVQAPE